MFNKKEIMKSIKEMAASYAAEKTNGAITDAIAQAYQDGYRQGYDDRENERTANLGDTAAEYVDLGLPSGTLWAADYVKSDDGSRAYIPYGQAEPLNIPTKEQWLELKESCKYGVVRDGGSVSKLIFKGPNGNILSFETTGYIAVSDKFSSNSICFWIKSEYEEGSLEREAVAIYGYDHICGHEHIDQIFIGYGLPVRLVK